MYQHLPSHKHNITGGRLCLHKHIFRAFLLEHRPCLSATTAVGNGPFCSVDSSLGCCVERWKPPASLSSRPGTARESPRSLAQHRNPPEAFTPKFHLTSSSSAPPSGESMRRSCTGLAQFRHGSRVITLHCACIR